MKDIITNKTGSSITFIVDENLPKPTEYIDDSHSVRSLAEGRTACIDILGDYISAEMIAASEGRNLYPIGKDVFFQTLVRSYAEHRPIVISPDMIWFLICQAFSHHINLDPEKYRHLFVDHNGKKGLNIVRGSIDEFTIEDWKDIIREFTEQIEQNTKGDIAATLISDFSTTTSIEAISSRVTLMSTVKAYFEFNLFRMICGIPHITLLGTVDDWRTILKKSKELSNFGLDWWISELVPILKEFVKAAEGFPDQTFWKNIVMTWRPDQIRGGGCVPDSEGPTMVDGWFLKFFPYKEDGRTPASVPAYESMLDETVSVPVNYRVINGKGEVVKEVKMNITAGLMGVTEDKETYALTPKFGWYIDAEESEEALFKRIQEREREEGLILQIAEVPAILKRFTNIGYLELDFTGKVNLPDWLENIEIETLVISGEMTEKDKEEIEVRFPGCSFI